MSIILVFIIGALAGGVAVWGIIFFTRTNKGVDDGGDKKEGLMEKQAEEKKKNKEIILGLLETNAPLTNNHIEQMLGISDATAERYLDELEKEGAIKQVGKKGRSVYYQKI